MTLTHVFIVCGYIPCAMPKAWHIEDTQYMVCDGKKEGGRRKDRRK